MSNTIKAPPAASDEDLFDALLNLEDSYYNEGYNNGITDGKTAGRLEGRLFGLEKGFEKYLTLGKVSGRTKVWQARGLSNDRHLRHLEVLKTLTSDAPIRNEEDDVEEVNDRIRRGKAKVKVLASALGEAGLDDGQLETVTEGQGMAQMARKVESEMN